MTWDARSVAPKLPLRLHANATFSLDGSGDLLGSASVTSIEEFALQINRYHRAGVRVGAEVPLPYVTPFVEYGLAVPLGAKVLVGPDDKPVSVASAMPQQLTAGARLTALGNLTLLAAVDVGLTHSVARGIPATPPYDALLGVSYAFDPFGAGASASAAARAAERDVPVERRREACAVAPATPATPAKVGPPSAGPSAEAPAMAAREPRGQAVQLALMSGKQRIPGGRVSLWGPRRTQVAVGADGIAAVELPIGRYTASADADGYVTRALELDVAEGGEQRFEVELAPAPKPALVVLKEDRIQLKQQVRFAAGKAVILQESHALLDQVTDAVRRAGIKRLRIESHTDSAGDKAVNLKLSRDWASAVLEFLVQRGVDRARLVAEGFGDTRPLAPNLTAHGRELNRRIELVILER